VLLGIRLQEDRKRSHLIPTIIVQVRRKTLQNFGPYAENLWEVSSRYSVTNVVSGCMAVVLVFRILKAMQQLEENGENFLCPLCDPQTSLPSVTPNQTASFVWGIYFSFEHHLFRSGSLEAEFVHNTHL